MTRWRGGVGADCCLTAACRRRINQRSTARTGSMPTVDPVVIHFTVISALFKLEVDNLFSESGSNDKVRTDTTFDPGVKAHPGEVVWQVLSGDSP